MRADRLLSIMLLLQVNGRMSGRDLATRLGVSERTIHRDMLALSASGVPVYAERGSQGGWSLVEDYRTNLTGLNPDEAQALALTVPARLLTDLGLNQASDAAYIKLMAALPSGNRQSAEFMRQRLHFDMSGWQQFEEATPCLGTIQDALWQERRLQITYERNDHSQVERLVDPLGLVAKGSVWYLVAAVDGAPRTYRVARVQSARISPEACLRPADFDLPAFWEQSKTEFITSRPRYPVTARIAPGMLERMRYAGRYTRMDKVELLSEPDADGWQEVRIGFEFEREAGEYLLSFGNQIEVLDPPELRQKLSDLARAVLELYSPS